MPRYLMSYSYNVPAFADFTVEAPNRDEALRHARAALSYGAFFKIAAAPEPDLAEDFAVELIGMAEPDDANLPVLKRRRVRRATGCNGRQLESLLNDAGRVLPPGPRPAQAGRLPATGARRHGGARRGR